MVLDEQLDLFGVSLKVAQAAEVYKTIDAIRAKYGKHTIFLGSSFLAHQHSQHQGEWGGYCRSPAVARACQCLNNTAL
jgi:hypothetical protein